VDGDGYTYWTNIDTPEYGTTYKRYLGGFVELRKRPTEDNLFLNASLTYQKLAGFGENLLTASYYGNPYQTDANINYYWGDDIGGFNWFAKAQATYFFENNWYLGITANWVEGTALSSTRTVAVPGYGNVTFYPNGRNDMERLPSQFTMNVQFGIEQTVEIPFDIPLWDDTLVLGIYANVYNILDNQSETNKTTNLASSAYNRPTTWLNARNYQLGFRIEL
jgi:hypothetical protein